MIAEWRTRTGEGKRGEGGGGGGGAGEEEEVVHEVNFTALERGYPHTFKPTDSNNLQQQRGTAGSYCCFLHKPSYLTECLPAADTLLHLRSFRVQKKELVLLYDSNRVSHVREVFK